VKAVAQAVLRIIGRSSRATNQNENQEEPTVRTTLRECHRGANPPERSAFGFPVSAVPQAWRGFPSRKLALRPLSTQTFESIGHTHASNRDGQGLAQGASTNSRQICLQPNRCARQSAPAYSLELNLLRHCLTVLVAKMAVGFHRQCSPVLMAEPARDGRNIHARFDAACGK